MTPSKALLLFEPEPEDLPVQSIIGLVSSIQQQRALLHDLFLDHIEQLKRQSDVHVTAWCTPGDSARCATTGPDNCVSDIRIQAGTTCGDRVSDAFQTLFEEGFKSVLLVSSHLVGSPRRHIREAFALLDTFDEAIVVGSVRDGSLGVLGMRYHARNFLQEFHTSQALLGDAMFRLLPATDLIILPLTTIHNPNSLDEIVQLVTSDSSDAGSPPSPRFIRHFVT